ncbi:hypothetical protein ACJJTC_008865 [Scirpophaga incertulas]
MHNGTSATLMLQTIMVLMGKQNGTDVTKFPVAYNDMELERCYEPYGCFSKGYPWTENRPDNYFPMPPESMAIRYPTFTRRNRKVPVFLKANNIERIQKANIDPRGPFYFISHGFLEGGHKPWETLGLSNVDNFHFIGHSLGSHLGGYCGHALQKKFNLKLGRITGLDPAAPHFSKTVTLVRLDRSDAKYVDIIHTNALPLYMSGLGISEPIGHVDFYPNGGSVQPGCKAGAQQGADFSPTVMKILGCSHVRSHELFTESLSPKCPFIGIQCESYEAFLAGNCTTCGPKHYCIPMGYNSYSAYKQLQNAGVVDTNSNIALYSMTGSDKPFCRVHYEIHMKVSNSTESRTHGPESGKVSITLVDRNNNKSDFKFLDDEQKYYKPGNIEKRMLAVKDKGYPPQYVIVEWKYETNLFNPMTWRLLKSPSIYIDYIKLSSIEYDTEITVCPKLNKPVVANLHTVMKTKYCTFGK